MDTQIVAGHTGGVDMQSQRCAEHGLSFLPDFWAMLFQTGGAEESTLILNWDLYLASVIGIQICSPDTQMQT
jgi:hypothetical protein